MVRLENGSSFALLYDNILATTEFFPKSPLRVMCSQYAYAAKNTLQGASNVMGPLSGLDARPGQKSDFIVFDSNTFKDYDVAMTERSNFKLTPGLRHSVVRNNIFIGTSKMLIGDGGRKYWIEKNKILGDPRPSTDYLDDVWVVNNTRVNGKNGSFISFPISGASSQIVGTTGQPVGETLEIYIRVKNFHFSNNLVASSTSTPAPTDGFILSSITGPITPKPTWRQELTQQLGDGDPAHNISPSRWWVKNNIWPVSNKFGIDSGATKSLAEWNNIWINSSLHQMSVDIAKNITVSMSVSQPTYRPTSPAANICSRFIFGGTSPWLQVAAWDRNNVLRPSSGVTAGAVQFV